jgi:palmitoyltransferase
LSNHLYDLPLQAVRWFPVVFITAIICWGYYAYVVQLCFCKFLANLFFEKNIYSVTITSNIERVLYLVPAHILLILFMWSYFATIFTPVGAPDKRVSFDPNFHRFLQLENNPILIQFSATPELLQALDGAASYQHKNAILEHHVRLFSLPVTMRDFTGGTN